MTVFVSPHAVVCGVEEENAEGDGTLVPGTPDTMLK
jgi:hypothetical protein